MLKLALLLAVPLLSQDIVRGTWDGRFRDDQTYLNVRISRGTSYSNYGRTYKTSELSDVVRSGGNVTFRLVRPAGVIVFSGKEDNGDAGGTWTFTISRSYAQEMRKLGFGDVDDTQFFTFAMCNLSTADARFMEENTADRLSASTLVRFCNHGVTPDYIRVLASAGYKNLDSEDIVRARDHGVSGEYVTEMGALGFRLSLQDLVRTRDHGVTPDFVREFQGFGDLTASSFVRLRDHGVNGRFAQEIRQLGYAADPEDLVRLRDHGVTASYIRRVNQEYGKKMDLGDVVRLRNRGY